MGIVEKVILRWRRKGSGLRGFKSEALIGGPSMQDRSPKEDDYDFFKEGRKQTEARSQIALARVKSMHQYPEARDQYRRLLNVVTEIQETKVIDILLYSYTLLVIFVNQMCLINYFLVKIHLWGVSHLLNGLVRHLWESLSNRGWILLPLSPNIY